MKVALKRLVRWLLPREISRRIYRWQADRYIDSLTPSYDPNKKSLLVLNHYWDQDIRALHQANHRYNLIVVDAPTLFKGAKLFFSPGIVQIKKAYESEAAENRRLYRGECRRIFERLHDRYQLCAIVTANDNYYWVREFIEVGREAGVPTVMLDKEGFLTPHTFRTAADRIKQLFPCICDHVYVWSDRQSLYWQRVGVRPESISVIGQPRSDLFFTEKGNEVDRYFETDQPLVTLFSYRDDICIPIEVIRQENLTWSPMRDHTHEQFYRFARRHPNFNFVIKAHPQQLDLTRLDKRYRRDNLRVIGGSAVANELIQRSELIVAFQTTVIVEAMFLDRRVLYTFWDRLTGRFENELFPFHKAEGIVIAKSADAFDAVLSRFLAGDQSDFDFSETQLKARDEFVNTYLHKPDGHVCERFFDSLDEIVK
ncbi:MAG: hypothetical protein JSU65_07640 [Candidatus Zixiibacteriota bacterium]|nr:MAG: hypothetical protein JSU65_07640 [candidate division Zixibacteria bacterium]